MASIQIRDVDSAMIEKLKIVARDEKRSLGQQILFILDLYLSERESMTDRSPQAIARLLRQIHAEPGASPTFRLPASSPGRADKRREKKILSILKGETE